MTVTLEDYQEIVGPEAIEELRVVADHVRHRSIRHINSTPVGGGVAEILTRLVPLMQQLGVNAWWDVIKGDEAFFNVTKAFHNALHGRREPISPEMFDIFRETTEANCEMMDLSGDVIVVHDPQPIGLAARRNHKSGWIWRCHIDVSAPDPQVWDFLQPWLSHYDASVFSMPDFARKLPITQFLVAPSIDPLSDKNRELSEKEIAKVFEKYRIDTDRPVLTQISRFDRLKDPLGVILAYRMVKRRFPCQLVLAGGGAPDDPEGAEVLREVRERASDDRDIHVILLPPYSDLEINALVRGSTIVFQKSVKEGFGLTVSEALWKRKPVIGGAVGGIKLQILNGVTGYLVHSPEGAANCAVRLLGDAGLREKMGNNGYQHVRQNFLLTRHVKDYLLLMLALQHSGEDIVQL